MCSPDLLCSISPLTCSLFLKWNAVTWVLSGFALRLLDLLYCVSLLSDSSIVVSTSTKKGCCAVTHRLYAYMKLRVPLWRDWSLL